MGYLSPMSPDVEDNPDFLGWYDGGCLGYLRDMAWGRNRPSRCSCRGRTQAAREHRRRLPRQQPLFHGHEVCTDNTWARWPVLRRILDLFNENTTRHVLPPQRARPLRSRPA
ncbi:hypothetical protein ACU686_32005 [Yinghuangia aomiensis]